MRDMRIKSKINDILKQLCKSNNQSVECIKEWTVELYNDFLDKDIPIIVRIILSDNALILIGKEKAENSICDILQKISQEYDEESFKIIVGKMPNVRLIESENIS